MLCAGGGRGGAAGKMRQSQIKRRGKIFKGEEETELILPFSVSSIGSITLPHPPVPTSLCLCLSLPLPSLSASAVLRWLLAYLRLQRAPACVSQITAWIYRQSEREMERQTERETANMWQKKKEKKNHVKWEREGLLCCRRHALPVLASLFCSRGSLLPLWQLHVWKCVL